MSKQRVIDKIVELFVVSPQDAQEYAKEFIELVESHGGLASQTVIDKQVPKVFGERLMWRNGKKQNEDRKKKATIGSYNDYINKKRN